MSVEQREAKCAHRGPLAALLDQKSYWVQTTADRIVRGGYLRAQALAMREASAVSRVLGTACRRDPSRDEWLLRRTQTSIDKLYPI